MRPGGTSEFGMADPPDDSGPGGYENQPGVFGQGRSGRYGCLHTVGLTVAVRDHHAVALLIPEHLIDLLNAHGTPLALLFTSAGRVPNMRSLSSGRHASPPIDHRHDRCREAAMSEPPRGQAAPSSSVITKMAVGRRCPRCGASTLEVAENPVTKKLQCRICGAGDN